MKKFLLSAIIFVGTLFGMFAKGGDINFGFVYGVGSAIYDETENGVTIEDVTANGCGFYLESMSEFTKYFGMYADISFIFPFKTELNYKYNGTSYSISDNDLFKISFVCPVAIGFNGIIPFSEKAKLSLGAGFDMAWLLSESKTEYSSYTVKTSETDNVFGLNLKGVFTYLFNEHIGLNVGLNGDFYFGGFYSSKSKVGSTSTTDSDTFSRTICFFRPEIGMTIHFNKD